MCILVLFLSLIRMLLMLCHQIGWKHFIILKKFLSIPSLLRIVLFTVDHTGFLSRSLHSFPYIFLENPEIVLPNGDLPALTSQLSPHSLELNTAISSLLLHSFTLDPKWPKERNYFCVDIFYSPLPHPPGGKILIKHTVWTRTITPLLEFSGKYHWKDCIPGF